MLVITRLTFQEAVRRRMAWVALALGLAFLVIYALGVNAITTEIQQATAANALSGLVRAEAVGFLAQAGLYVVNFLSIMLMVLTSVDTLSGEIATGTVHTLVSKPVRRWEIVLGKALGFALMLSLYLLFMVGGVALVVYTLGGGYVPPNLPLAFGLVWLNGVLMLSLSLMGGARLSTLANGVVVFGLFGVAFVGGWIEQIGAVLGNRTAVDIGILSSLLLPGDALWRLAAAQVQSPLSGSLMGGSPFSAVSVPSPAMVMYAVAYAVVMLALAVRAFDQRDL